MRVSCKVGKVLPDSFVLNLLSQEVCLVEEENHRDVSETAVVDNCVKDVDALNQAVCNSVFQECLVEGT